MEGNKVGSGGLRAENFLRPRPLYRWKAPLSKKSCHDTPIFIHSSLPTRFHKFEKRHSNSQQD